jgi:ribokinase
MTSATPPRICVVGSSNIDLTFRAPRLPQPGETLAGLAFHLGFGGKGANQAVMAARLGAHVTMVSKIGGDVFGEGTLRNYRDQGVDTTYVRADTERTSGVAGIVVDDAARNCIIVVGGANLGLSPDDVQEAAGAIRSAAVLLCQLEVPLESTLQAFRVARAAGVRTILNPAPAVPLPDELLRLTDICAPNETEIELLTGRAVQTAEGAEAAARSLQKRGPQTVIVTLGARGAWIVEGERSMPLAPMPVDAVDPTGAGDAFLGALAVYLAEGQPLLEAARWASTAAALSVTRLGAQTAFPTRPEVEAAPRAYGNSLQ